MGTLVQKPASRHTAGACDTETGCPVFQDTIITGALQTLDACPPHLRCPFEPPRCLMAGIANHGRQVAMVRLLKFATFWTPY
jgi:hypothetical protein